MGQPPGCPRFGMFATADIRILTRTSTGPDRQMAGRETPGWAAGISGKRTRETGLAAPRPEWVYPPPGRPTAVNCFSLRILPRYLPRFSKKPRIPFFLEMAHSEFAAADPGPG